MTACRIFEQVALFCFVVRVKTNKKNSAGDLQDLSVMVKRLSPRASELLADQYRGFPVWVRAPKQGVEFYCGLSRSKLYEGTAKRHFRSVSIREPGQTKGTRLFHLGSILEYIDRCEAAGKGGE